MQRSAVEHRHSFFLCSDHVDDLALQPLARYAVQDPRRRRSNGVQKAVARGAPAPKLSLDLPVVQSLMNEIISTAFFICMICIHLEDRDGVGLRLAAVALVDRDELLVQQRRVVPRPLTRGLGLLNLSHLLEAL